ncbi:MAG: hypothetical protein WC889_07955 [Myxococcota bacterium]|jgi:pimeloyl-ACP methyl ester carboxylesterase
MKRARVSFLMMPAMVLSLAAVCGCSQDSAPPIDAGTGFVTIKPVTYQFLEGARLTNMTTDEARMWYSFQPSAADADVKPLAVFYNGGPGASTSLLMGFNTGPRSLDRVFNGGVPVGPGPADWSKIANLLYIDARNTGFSYSIGDAQGGFEIRNFNTYIDAGDFIRVLMKFFDEHEALRSNPVIFVGESYGGLRTSLILNIILNYRRYSTTSPLFRDRALAALLQKHFDKVFPGTNGNELPPATISKQFGRQVLIEPLLFGSVQHDVMGEMLEAPGSPMYQIAAETGKKYLPCKDQGSGICYPWASALAFAREAGRDVYKYDETGNWTDDTMYATMPVLMSKEGYSSLLLSDPLGVSGMYASARAAGYNIAGSGVEALAAPEGQMAQVAEIRRGRFAAMLDTDAEFQKLFGTLNGDSRYNVPWNETVMMVFSSDLGETSQIHRDTGLLMLENLLYVKTLITNAGYDLMIYAPAFPGCFARYPDRIESVKTGEAEFTVTYKAGSFTGVASGETRTVTFPSYEKSGHSVSVSEPVKLLDDVKAWMRM